MPSYSLKCSISIFTPDSHTSSCSVHIYIYIYLSLNTNRRRRQSFVSRLYLSLLFDLSASLKSHCVTESWYISFLCWYLATWVKIPFRGGKSLKEQMRGRFNICYLKVCICSSAITWRTIHAWVHILLPTGMSRWLSQWAEISLMTSIVTFDHEFLTQTEGKLSSTAGRGDNAIVSLVVCQLNQILEELNNKVVNMFPPRGVVRNTAQWEQSPVCASFSRNFSRTNAKNIYI